jgi:Fe-S-cluster containining protein
MAGDKWYQGGLRFTCTQCGNCCTGPPGYVWVSKEEIAKIAEFLEHQDGWLPKDLLRRVGFKYSLTEKPNGDCVFLQPGPDGKRGCSIYPVRPLQCRTWPFWNQNLRTPSAWAEASERCPGMNNGEHHNFVSIEQVRLKKSWIDDAEPPAQASGPDTP